MTIYAHNNLFIQNKYYNWYFALIAKARTKTYDDYSEVHHIIPRSLGGTDDPTNLVRLSYRDHFLCHWLLIKFVITTEAKTKMSYALLTMTWYNTKQERIVSSWQFEVIKRAAKDNMRGENHPHFGKKIYNNDTEEMILSDDQEIPEGFVLGRSDETKRKIGVATLGKKRYNNGEIEILISPDQKAPDGFVSGSKPPSEETRRKLGDITRGRKFYNNGIKEILIFPDQKAPEGFVIGRLPVSEDFRRKISVATLGKKRYNNGEIEISISADKEIPDGFVPGSKPTSEETRRKLQGKKYYNNGIKNLVISKGEEIPEGFVLGRLPSSEETRQILSKSKTGKKQSEEIKRKRRGKKWYNNGIEDMRLSVDQEIPEGFVPGRSNLQRK
jgi:hypothetical protein